MGTPTIELDTTQPWEPPEPPPRHRALPRWLLAVLVLAVVAVAPIGEVAGSPYAPLVTGKELGVALFIGGDTLFQIPNDQSQPQRVRAFDLASGKLRWERHFGLDEAEWSAVGGVLFQSVGNTEASWHLPARLRAIDPATGRTLWERNNAQAEFAIRDRIVLLQWPELPKTEPAVPDAAPEGQPPVTVYVVEARTGKVVWTRVASPPWSFARRSTDWWDPFGLHVSGSFGRLAELLPTGELRLTDLSTGQESTPVKLPLRTPAPYFDLVDDSIWFDDDDHLISYDVNTGRQRARILAPDGGITCGVDLFCVDDFQGDGQITLRLVRPSTGETVLQLPNAVLTGAMGRWMLIQGDFRSGNRNTSIVDMAGDRIPRPLAPWQSARVLDNGRVLAVGHVIGRGEATVAVVDLDTRHATVVGRIGDWFVPPECHRYADHVLCTSASAWAVWRLPADR